MKNIMCMQHDCKILLSLGGDITMVEHWMCFVVVEKFMQDLKDRQKGRIPARRESLYFRSY